MGIDGIGKGPPAGPIAPEVASKVGQAVKTGAEAEPFRVEKGAPVEGAAPVSLDRVRSGDISMEQYLDTKVNEVTSHLADRLTPEQMAFVRDNLRQQLSTDPVLVDLVKAATGTIPPRRE